VLDLPESSWGEGGGHFVWDNPDTKWMWPIIHDAEARIEALAGRFAAITAPVREVADQAAREALLLQSSDWPFLVTTGQARDYAIERFHTHVERFNRLCDVAESDSPSEDGLRLAREYYDLDTIFPDIDLRLFRRIGN
jgi:1,4-alpha-glucan branching enzyme